MRCKMCGNVLTSGMEIQYSKVLNEFFCGSLCADIEYEEQMQNSTITYDDMIRMLVRISPSQRKVLKAIHRKTRLLEVVKKLDGTKKKDAPRIYRHLQNLIEKKLVNFDRRTKNYGLTNLGEVLVK